MDFCIIPYLLNNLILIQHFNCKLFDLVCYNIQNWPYTKYSKQFSYEILRTLNIICILSIYCITKPHTLILLLLEKTNKSVKIYNTQDWTQIVLTYYTAYASIYLSTTNTHVVDKIKTKQSGSSGRVQRVLEFPPD